MLHALSFHLAKHAVLLLPVLKEDIARRQVGRIEVVKQQFAFRVYGHHRNLLAVYAPLPDEAHRPCLPLNLLKAHDIFAPSAQEGCQRQTVVAHESR